MIGDGSREIRREYAGSDVRFELPVRPLGKGKWIGVLLIGFGLLFMWSPARALHQTVQRWLQDTPGGEETLLSLFQLPLVIGCCVPLGIGLLILFGRCRVEWKDGQLRSTEILGPLRWTRCLPDKPVRKLEVGAATSRSGNSAPRELAQFSGLTAEFDDGSKKLVVLGYPKDWLLALAQELKNYVGGDAFSAAASEVEVVDKSLTDAGNDDVMEQPAGSRIQVEEHATGVRVVVPPAGLRKGSKCLLGFGIIWCLFMCVFTGFEVFFSVKSSDHTPLPVWIFISVFWLIGLGLLAGAINMGQRTAVLVVEGGRLSVETSSLFGRKRRQWSRGDLAAIRADASGMEVNDVPIVELQIHPAIGKKVGFFAGRQDQELRWMATRLRRALDLPASIDRNGL